MNSRLEKKLKNQRIWVTGLGKGRSGTVPVPDPWAVHMVSVHVRSHPRLHGCHRETGFTAGYRTRPRVILINPQPCKGPSPRSSPRGPSGLPAPPSGSPRAPAARHGSDPVSLEGTRVIFSTKP